MIKESIADDSNNKIPMIVMSEDGKLDNSKIDFKQQNLTIYVPNGAHVTVNGKAATKIEQNKNYNTFTFSVIFDTYGRQTVEISVSYNGVTEVTNRVIYQRADSRYLLLDLENSDTVKSINKMDNASVVQVQDDYGVAMHFENSARRQSVVFGNDILDGDITSVSYTHLDVYKRQVQVFPQKNYRIFILCHLYRRRRKKLIAGKLSTSFSFR